MAIGAYLASWQVLRGFISILCLMTPDSTFVPPPATDGLAFLAQFAHRVATRDEPPAPPVHGYDRASLEDLIARALKVGHLSLRMNRARTQARLCYALMLHPRLNTQELAAAAGVTRLTVYKVFPELRQRHLADDEQRHGRHYHFLTRTGEDWLLDVTK
jgi:hypothetical protein